MGPPHTSHLPTPFLQKDHVVLSHALLEAATRGQALTSHQDYGKQPGVRVSKDRSLRERQVS